MTGSSERTPAFGCVVLTQGRRPADLRRGIESLLAQQDVMCDIVVVGNGWDPTGLPPGVRGVHLPENVGIPGGRNAGIDAVAGDLLFFLDDDASLPDSTTLQQLAVMFAEQPDLGIVQLRVVDPSGVANPRRHVPRLLVGDPGRSSDVTSFWEGASAIRRGVFDRAGRWPTSFFYAHEGVDLAWRAMAAGFRVHYAGHLIVHHPVVAPTRHGFYHYLSARNRMWLARQHLPLPLAVVHVAVWLVLSLLRVRSVKAVRDIARGYADGLRTSPGPRRPLSWETIWRMTRIGRPPVI